MMFAEYLKVFASDERFLVFAIGSLVVASAVIYFSIGTNFLTRLLLLSGGFFLAFSFVILAPLSSLALFSNLDQVSPVELYYNVGFFALGLGLFLKFRHVFQAPAIPAQRAQ